MSRVYVASSWRNEYQPAVVEMLRSVGHDVYDFRNPPNGSGFSWRAADPTYIPGSKCDFDTYVRLLGSPVARKGFESDMQALVDADVVVYVLPCGRSASWEFGYAMGQGKGCYVLWIGEHEPDLMFREAVLCRSLEVLENNARIW